MAERKVIEFQLTENAATAATSRTPPPAPVGLPPGSSSGDAAADAAAAAHNAFQNARSNARQQAVEDWYKDNSVDTSSSGSGDIDATIKALSEEFETLSAASQAAAKAGQASAAASSGMASSAAGAAAALGGGGGAGAGGAAGGAAGAAGAAGGAAAAGLTLAGAAVGAAVAIGVLMSNAALFNKVVEGLVETMGQYSGQVQSAVAAGQVQKVQDDLRAAQEVGGTLAALQETRNALESSLRGILREGTELLGPLLNGIGKTMGAGLDVIEGTLELTNGALNAVAEGIDALLDEANIASDTRSKIEKNTRPKYKTDMPFEREVNDLFDADNLGVDAWGPEFGDPRN